MTPRTLEESLSHNLDLPGAAGSVRRYSRGTRSADWKAEDRRKWRTIAGVILAAVLLFWLG